MSHAISLRNCVLVAIVAALQAGPGLCAGAAPAPPAIAPAAPPPAAHWVERTFTYTYSGFTTKFSCDGLRDTISQVLLALGARKQDMDLKEVGCSHLDGPEPFPGVKARFSALVPVTPDEIGKVGQSAAQATQWQTVDLVSKTNSGPGQNAPCELLEQLKDKLVPLFTSRNLDFRSSCVPHQISPGEIRFKIDVLRVAPASATPGAAPTPTA